MSNFFKLSLDTTSPELMIYAPKYVDPDENINFIISSNERLDGNFQDVFFVDCINGDKYHVVTVYDEDKNEFYGSFSMTVIKGRKVELHITLRDVVNNVATSLFLITIHRSNGLVVSNLKSNVRKLLIDDKKMKLTNDCLMRKITLSDKE